MKRIFTTVAMTVFFMSMGLSCNSTSVNTQHTEAGDGGRVVKTYDLKNFSGLSTATAVKVLYTPTTSGKVSIKADIDADLAPYFKVKVENGMLSFQFKKNGSLNVKSNNPAIVTVTGPALRKMEASSASTIELTEAMNYNGTVEIDASSAASVKTKGLKCNALDADASSAASLNFANVNCTNADLDCSSAANITISALACKKAELDGSSSGNLKIKDLQCNGVAAAASSGGGVSLAGRCAGTAVLNASSGGSVKARSLKATSINAKTSSGGSVSYDKNAGSSSSNIARSSSSSADLTPEECDEVERTQPNKM